MKTLNDLQKMKTIKCEPFENEYEYFISTLVDYYIAKVDGLNKIYNCLQEWDFESKVLIVNILIKHINKTGLEEFDEIEFKNKLLS